MKTQKLLLTALTLATFACSQPPSQLRAPQDSLQLAACQPPPAPPTVSDGQAAFDRYSWLTFIALNWPASPQDRGQPNCSQPLDGSGPRVWQTYKTANEVFLPGARDPGPWNQGYTAKGTSQTIRQIAKATRSTAIDADQEAVGGWLIDQRKNPTYFQMWVNKPWYNYVVDNAFYNKDNFSNRTRITLPDRAMELKSAWRILTADDASARYITQTAEVATFDEQGQPTGNTQTVTLGLVGLHIIVKAPGYPQWIWATFEHLDNVPPSHWDASSQQVVSKPQAGVDYSYYNKAAAEPNQSPCRASDPTQCQSFTQPTPLTRVTPIRDSAAQANSRFRTGSLVKGTVLENYQLITTQWPAKPNNPGATNGDPTPTVSANTTMESYIQSSSNCMNCHGMATLPGLSVKADYSFLFYEAHSANQNP